VLLTTDVSTLASRNPVPQTWHVVFRAPKRRDTTLAHITDLAKSFGH